MAPTDSSPAPEQPVDPRAAALAEVAQSSDVAYDDGPLSQAEQTAANEAGISLAGDVDPAEVRRLTAESGTGTPDESVAATGDTRTPGEYDPEEAPTPEQTTRSELVVEAPSRDAALEALLGAYEVPAPAAITLTGTVVDLGGDLERVVTMARYNAVHADHPEYGAQGAVKGDVVLVSEEEAERGERLGGLAELPSEVEPGDAGAELVVEDEGGILSDEVLASREFTVDRAIAYTTAHPDELDRVIAAEEARSRPRSGVMALRQ